MRSKFLLLENPGRWRLLIGFAVIMAVACAGTVPRPSARANSPGEKAQLPAQPQIAKSAETRSDLVPVERRLRSEVRQWQGTPHRMGGVTRQGIDCSGFVQRLYRDIFRRQIPRSTALQVKTGRPIGRSQLRAGDLVFFHVPHKGRHVGIYLGREEFAHASTTKGVTISSLADDFWRRAYWTARRYLNAPNWSAFSMTSPWPNRNHPADLIP
jgi:cell wall-associated NlpC family hydrolase